MALKILIMGGGPGGYVAAIRAAKLGAEVVLVEAEEVGGTCLNWGCIPSKVLKTTADLLEKCRQATGFGIRLDQPPQVDMPGLMARKDKVVQTQVKGIQGLLAKAGVRVLKGHCRIIGKHRAVVASGRDKGREIEWDRLIIATGTRPMALPDLPFDGQQILSSNHALSLGEVPGSILIVGGGVIGCEFAFILSALGARVSVVEALDRLLPLPSVDPDISALIEREMKKRKIKVHCRHTLAGANPGPPLTAEIRPVTQPADGSEAVQVDVDQLLVCIGRTPNTADIGLETIGLDTDQRGWIAADAHMQTRVKDVFAIGDVLGPQKIMLAHVASAEGLVAAENAVGANGAKASMDYRFVPGAIFTMPEAAGVGLTEHQAREHDPDVRAETFLFRQIGKPHVLGEIIGQVKLVFQADTGKLLGAHMAGPHATDLIAEAVLALEMGATVHDLARTIHAHPTLSEAVAETAHKAAGTPIHGG